MPSYFSRACFLILTLSPVIALGAGNAPKTSDWNRIHALSPGMITHVNILKDQALSGQRKFKGIFSSSTETSITIISPIGQTITFQKRVISTVRVRRPFRKRYAGFAIGISTAVIAGYLYSGPRAWDLSTSAKFIFPALITAPATVAGFFMMPTRLVYRAPLDS